MGVGELLDATFSMYRRNFLLIAAISAIVQVPYAVLSFLLYEGTGVASFAGSSFSSSSEVLTPDQRTGLTLVTLAAAVFSLLVVLPLGEAATTRAVSDRYLDREASLGASYRAALRRLGALVTQSLILLAGVAAVTTAITALAVGVGAAGGGGPAAAVTAVVLGIAVAPVVILVYVRTSLAAPVIVIEARSGWRGLTRSWALVRGMSWRMFGIRLLLLLITGIIGGLLITLVSLPASGLDANSRFIASQAASAVVAVFVGPLTYIGVTLLYYDARIRKEGFDIEMLAQSL